MLLTSLLPELLKGFLNEPFYLPPFGFEMLLFGTRVVGTFFLFLSLNKLSSKGGINIQFNKFFSWIAPLLLFGFIALGLSTISPIEVYRFLMNPIMLVVGFYIGSYLGKKVKDLPFFMISAFHLILADSWSVWAGLSLWIIETGRVNYFLYFLPVPFAGCSVGLIGFVDPLFLAFFLEGSRRFFPEKFGKLEKSFFWATLGVLFLTQKFRLALPLLFFYSPLFLLFSVGNLKEKFERNHYKLLIFGILAIIGLALIFPFIKPPIVHE